MNQEIVATKITMVDNEGRRRAEIATTPDGYPYLYLGGSDNKLSVSIDSTKYGANIFLLRDGQ